MEALKLEENKAEKILFSTDGERIEAGETFFLGEEHGRPQVLSLSEYEQFLGLRDFTAASRKKLAASGAALPDGSFPIANCKDADNAEQAIGRTPASNRDRVKAHIAKRRKALGCPTK